MTEPRDERPGDQRPEDLHGAGKAPTPPDEMRAASEESEESEAATQEFDAVAPEPVAAPPDAGDEPTAEAPAPTPAPEQPPLRELRDSAMIMGPVFPTGPSVESRIEVIEARRENLTDILAAAASEKIPDAIKDFAPPEVAEALNESPIEVQLRVLRALPHEDAIPIFDFMDVEHQAALLQEFKVARAEAYLEGMSPDVRADLFAELPPKLVEHFLQLIPRAEQDDVRLLLTYEENTAGGRMTSDFAWIGPDDTVAQAIEKVRTLFKDVEMLYYLYVLDIEHRLLGLVTLRYLITAPPETRIGGIMHTNVIAMQPQDDQEVVAREMALYDFIAMPIVDDERRMLGIVTFDDVADVVADEATEDIQKIGGLAALEDTYIATPFWTLMRKRAGWLLVLLVGEMLTATAMGRFEMEIAQAVVLALFVPLIISSGGNSGSQAASLIIRALAVGEVTLRDWWSVAKREFLGGLVLGAALGAVGFLRIAIWGATTDVYGPHWPMLALTIGVTLTGVVMWGSLAGSMLPLLLKRLGLDPAVSSAPFVATLVDVTGIFIYFEVAALTLRGTLL